MWLPLKKSCDEYLTFDKKVKASQKVSNLYIVDISAKNKYGWGPPSSTFTFYNKGVGKSHFIYEIFYLYENRDEEKQENFHFLSIVRKTF